MQPVQKKKAILPLHFFRCCAMWNVRQHTSLNTTVHCFTAQSMADLLRAENPPLLTNNIVCTCQIQSMVKNVQRYRCVMLLQVPLEFFQYNCLLHLWMKLTVSLHDINIYTSFFGKRLYRLFALLVTKYINCLLKEIPVPVVFQACLLQFILPANYGINEIRSPNRR